MSMTTHRIATTITNVKEGTLGAKVRHLMAVSDALHTAQQQLRLARDAGEITSSQYYSASADLAPVERLCTDALVQVSKDESAKANRIMEALGS